MREIPDLIINKILLSADPEVFAHLIIANRNFHRVAKQNKFFSQEKNISQVHFAIKRVFSAYGWQYDGFKYWKQVHPDFIHYFESQGVDLRICLFVEGKLYPDGRTSLIEHRRWRHQKLLFDRRLQIHLEEIELFENVKEHHECEWQTGVLARKLGWIVCCQGPGTHERIYLMIKNDFSLMPNQRLSCYNSTLSSYGHKQFQLDVEYEYDDEDEIGVFKLILTKAIQAPRHFRVNFVSMDGESQQITQYDNDGHIEHISFYLIQYEVRTPLDADQAMIEINARIRTWFFKVNLQEELLTSR